MKIGFYPKLAWMGIRRNSQLYTPYLLTCIGMVTMSYIVAFLANSPLLDPLSGSSVMKEFLKIGFVVFSVFALIFLFYTNSFLIRRRKKELGLYNILGMGKKNLALVLLWEAAMMGAISLAGGVFCGITLSKFSELVLMNLLKEDIDFTLRLSGTAIIQTLGLFAVIFGLIFLNTLRQLHVTSPVALLHSEDFGEKPPKTNWLMALAGALLLAAAYWIAVSIQDPVSAILWFMIAVIMVIIATYLLFIAGSVAICRILQKNKRYYYKTNHFVSVSSMIYRMRRNGAGLASICILCTMVLVTLSSTTCLYLGAEDSLRQSYPRNIYLDLSVERDQEDTAAIQQQIQQYAQKVVEQAGTDLCNDLSYSAVSCRGKLENGELTLQNSLYNSADYNQLYDVMVVPLEDYNRLMGTQETLEPGQALLYLGKDSNYTGESIQIEDRESLQIVKRVDGFADYQMDRALMRPVIYLFVEDFDAVTEPMLSVLDEKGSPMTDLHWYYGFDLEASEQQQIGIYQQIQDWVLENGYNARCQSVAEERSVFYGLYGGLFFLGILFGIVFIFAAVLIIYYKQVSEGYEDRARFEILRKVGMTGREIRQSINSQVLTVFFLPLLTAGVHLGFAFPLIYKVLSVFGLINLSLLLAVTVGCYLIFALFYILVYRITSGSYYKIVSGPKETL